MINFIEFPDTSQCDEDGLLAAGGDLRVDTLVSAYKQGIFPWFNDDQPVLWWSPDPRLVLFPEQIKVSRSLKKLIRQQFRRYDGFQLKCDTAFSDVVQACAGKRLNSEETGTWITDDMLQAYTGLHEAGYAHSIEIWQADTLVGGLYGIAMGNVFFGESMFGHVSNASKIALVALSYFLAENGFSIIDCQVKSDHLLSMGATEITRSDFLQHTQNIDIQLNSSDFSEKFEIFNINNAIS